MNIKRWDAAALTTIGLADARDVARQALAELAELRETNRALLAQLDEARAERDAEGTLSNARNLTIMRSRETIRRVVVAARAIRDTSMALASGLRLSNKRVYQIVRANVSLIKEK